MRAGDAYMDEEFTVHPPAQLDHLLRWCEPRTLDGREWYEAASIAHGLGNHTVLLVAGDTLERRVMRVRG